MFINSSGNMVKNFMGGKIIDEVVIMGFSSRRSDTPAIARTFEKEMFSKILYGANKKDVDDFIQEVLQQIREAKPEDIALPIGVSKGMEDYKSNPIHIRACNLANQRHNANIQSGDRVKYIYVKQQPEGMGKFENVIAFKGKMPHDYKIDYDKMEERLVWNKVKPIYDALGWNKQKSTSLFDF